jgi:hypothetical protein
MEVSIKIIFRGDYYPFRVDWKLPFFPSVGDTLELDDILSENQLLEAEKIQFIGQGKYEGLVTNLRRVISGTLDCKVSSISWMKENVDLMVINETYSQLPERWKRS